MTMKLTRLSTPETLSAFGELFTLVYNNGTQQSAILMPKIQGLSEKAQNQIYGRFYQASHPLEKNPAKGRELLSKNGDFMGLASKFLEVKTDIELSAKIYKLFQENAPIKTIHSSYKKLSTASRKEIEEHLGMTAAKAAPQALQAALVKVFDGMGAYNSAPIQKKEDKEDPEDIFESLCDGAKVIRNDLDIADLYRSDINSEEKPDRTHMREIYGKFSRSARIMIELILKQQNPLQRKPGEANTKGRQLQRAIRTFFAEFFSDDSVYLKAAQEWKASREDALQIHLYMTAVSLIRDALPLYSKHRRISEEELLKNLKTLLKGADTTEFATILTSYRTYRMGIVLGGEDKVEIFGLVLASETPAEECAKALLTLPLTDLGEFRRILQVPLEGASKEELCKAVNKHIENVVTRWKADHKGESL